MQDVIESFQARLKKLRTGDRVALKRSAGMVVFFVVNKIVFSDTQHADKK